MDSNRRSFVARAATGAVALPAVGSAHATFWLWSTPPAYTPTAVAEWNRTLIGAIMTARSGPTVAARAASMMFEAVYNAWATFDLAAGFTLAAMRKQPLLLLLQDDRWKRIAIGHAAYTVLVDLFPTQKPLFDVALQVALAGLPTGQSFGVTARQTGELAGNAMIAARAADGSNQKGGFNGSAATPYADWTGYVPVNTPDNLVDPTRWQPLRVPLAGGGFAVQQYLTPHWGQVRPFALSSGATYRPTMDHRAPTENEMLQLLNLSAGLNDSTKALVDFFAQNPGSPTPPGQWLTFAAQVAANDRNGLDADVQLFFACAQAGLDASIAAWDAKRAYDSVRPITAIPHYLRGRTVMAWAGYNRGVRQIQAETWIPYQRATNPTPPFPEFVSGHSTFSASAATVIAGLRGSDTVTVGGVLPAGGIGFEDNTPAAAQGLWYPTLSAAADAAGLSRRYGGIHFEQGDLKGRALGRQVGAAVLARCRTLFAGGRLLLF